MPHSNFEPSLFILGRFSLLGLDLGPDIKMGRGPRSFGPTIAPQILLSGSSDGDKGFDVLGVPYRLVKSCHLLALGPFRLLMTRFWHFGIQSVSSLNSDGSVLPTLDGVMVI